MTHSSWESRVFEIKEMLSEGISLETIGKRYGVSKQRIYQVLRSYGLETYRQRRRGKWGNSPRHLWLDKVLMAKGVSVKDRHEILEVVDLPDRCPILGIELKYVSGRVAKDEESTWGYRTDSSPSIDKIVPSLGYTIGNIHVISWRANRIKNDGTPEEHRKISDYIVDILQKSSCGLQKNVIKSDLSCD